MQTTEWVPLLTLAANIGFSVVVAWYLLSKALPSMQDRFSADLKATRDHYELSLKTQRDDYHIIMLREKETLAKLVEALTGRDSDIIKQTAEQVTRILPLVEDLARRKV